MLYRLARAPRATKENLLDRNPYAKKLAEEFSTLESHTGPVYQVSIIFDITKQDLRTQAPIIPPKLKLLKHHLIAIRLQRERAIRGLRQDQIRLLRITLQHRLVIEEGVLPDSPLAFPVDDETLLHRAAEGEFPKVAALGEVGSNVGSFVAGAAGYAVGD